MAGLCEGSNEPPGSLKEENLSHLKMTGMKTECMNQSYDIISEIKVEDITPVPMSFPDVKTEVDVNLFVVDRVQQEQKVEVSLEDDGVERIAATNERTVSSEFDSVLEENKTVCEIPKNSDVSEKSARTGEDEKQFEFELPKICFSSCAKLSGYLPKDAGKHFKCDVRERNRGALKYTTEYEELASLLCFHGYQASDRIISELELNLRRFCPMPGSLPSKETLRGYSDIPHVLEDTPLINRQRIHFLHDGAPAHLSCTARRYLDRRFPDRWIGRGGPIAWPPRSPDLNPLVFYLWGHLKSLVYLSPVPDLESLWNRIVACSEDIRNTPGVWDRVRRSMRHRCEVCIQAGGGHFEHLL
ncbi:hypothetical protein ANN_27538 [Periplaneta americana]|uniref:Tc1-like transposase DDE domain-containing protein n=1 Tax=Periplaneta americana TaxID=6978 RepID=A0ABQ8RWA3_PERAM|nr:hypothetical protein ANN_27538 [Periplaneta americana]